MDSTNQKVSFIPKGSLVRDEFFLERSRPRSVLGAIASVVFVITTAAYFGLYYYNNSLNKIVAEKTIEIKKAQKEFSDAPEVGEAKVFRARAELARELLNSHTVTSPVLDFLSKNTLSSILYNRFVFKTDALGSTLELAGEAPTYAAVAYQADILREKKTELASVSVRDVTLTNFGTVSFSLTMVFNPDFLLYTKNLKASEIAASTPTTEQAQGTTSSGSFGGTINFDTPVATTSEPTPVVVPAQSTEVVATSSELVIPENPETLASSTDATPVVVEDAGAITPVADGWTDATQVATDTASAPVPSFWSKILSMLKFW